jgi:PKD repeat protein
MNNIFRSKLVAIVCLMFLTSLPRAGAQSIFVKFSTSRTATNSVNAVNPPPGNSFSAAAPFSGNFWNVVTQSNNCPPGTIAPFDTNLYVNLPLVDSSNNLLAATLTVGYHLAVNTGTRIEPSAGNGENTLQPGGVMQFAWRNFQTGNFSTWTFSNLTANAQYGLYVYGGTGSSGQSALISNISGSAAILVTSNVVANSAGAFGAIWTISGGATNLMPQGKAWNFVTGQADANGVFSFIHGFKSDGNFRYMNGFQLVPLSAPSATGPTNQTIIAGNAGTLNTTVTGFPTPSLQWLENGTNVVGATNTTLVLPNVQFSQNNFTYSLVAGNVAGSLTNTMTLSVIVTPSINNLTNQASSVGNNVVISPTVSGVPTPVLQWQFNNSNVTDGAQPDGSTNSGSATATLSISNAQTNETGTFCLIASNSAGVVTNCMNLTVSSGNVAPSITGLTDQTVVQGNNGTFSASISGLPTPTQQWYDNGGLILGATGTSLILTNVQYLTQDGHVYSIIASNAAGTATNSATLHVFVPPSISSQPQSLVVTNTQAASFSVTAAGVPAPTYQWLKNNSPIPNATNSLLTFASAQPSDMATYDVVVSNVVSSVTSSNATLVVNSTMGAVSLTPSNGATAVCYDTPLYITFDRAPVLRNTGQIRIYAATNTASPVDTLDMSLNISGYQSRNVAGESLNVYPVIITGNQAAIYPHLDLLGTNQTYYVTIDNGVFADATGAYFAGVTDSNTWKFTTKPTGPANPNNIVVAADGSGDFCTCQGAVDYVPSANNTYRLINVRNGNYVEIVDVNNGKSNLTFRGQSRAGTVVGYANNAVIAPGGSTHSRMAFKVNTGNIAIENLTVLNRTPKGGGQAEALLLDTSSQRFILNNAEVDSYQDTVLGGQAYFNNSLIQGDVDYIWGGFNLFATNCEIRTLTAGGNITQCRSTALSNGMAFVNCRVTVASNGVTGVTLGRAIGVASSTVAFVSCELSTNISGWNAADIGTPSLGLRWWEFGNSNLTGTASLTFNGIQLTNGDVNLACAQSAPCWLYGWTPQLAPNILTNPVSVTVTAGVTATFSVAATGIPDPTYQWLLNGTNYVNATSTSATLVISNALAGNAGVYSVIVSNSAGTVTSTNVTLTVVGTGPSASFMASPTSGTEPLTVTFTDTSSGSPNLSLFWNLGDATTTNTSGGASFMHAYAAGTYTVTLTASNAFGANSVLVSNNLISVITAFQAWQLQYFGCTNCPNAAANADPLGKGMSNFDQFLAGINPTNPASALRIISVTPSGSDVVVTWTTAGGHTNVVQANAGDGSGGYTTNFSDLSGLIVISGSGDTSTNYTDVGGATNNPSRYYRVRLSP